MNKITVELSDFELSRLKIVEKCWDAEPDAEPGGYSLEYVIATLATKEALGMTHIGLNELYDVKKRRM